MVKNALSKSNRPTILALSWRDIRAPKAGGAEVQTHEMLKRIAGKVRVIHFSPMFEGAKEQEDIEGVTYLREGNIFSVIWYAFQYYKKNKDKIDYVIDQCNTHRFFSKFWVKKEKRVFLIYQLTKEIWKINLPFPLSYIGMVSENFMLKLNKHDITITESESTKNELIQVGFERDKIHIIPIGLKEEIYNYEGMRQSTKEGHSLVYVGRYSRYKGMDKGIESLAQVKKQYPDSKLYVCGKREEEFVEQIICPMCDTLGLKLGNLETEQESDVVLCGFVSEEKKYAIMASARLLLFPSIREGWGIIVTEAAYLGTPSVVYDAPGSMEAVDYGRTGYVAKEHSVSAITKQIYYAFENETVYNDKQAQGIAYAGKFCWEKNGNMLYNILFNIDD